MNHEGHKRVLGVRGPYTSTFFISTSRLAYLDVVIPALASNAADPFAPAVHALSHLLLELVHNRAPASAWPQKRMMACSLEQHDGYRLSRYASRRVLVPGI